MTILENVALAPHTTFKIGGRARYFATVTSLAELTEALSFARTKELAVFVLGGGSNVLVADTGFEGLVIACAIAGIEVEKEGEMAQVKVGAGVWWDDFVVWTIAQGYRGLECMSGVPGTVGGAVVANVGAYGAQVSDTLLTASVIDTKDAQPALRVRSNADCAFSYHDSMFGRASGRYVVVEATFALSRDPQAVPAYRDNRFDMTKLAQTLGHEPTPRDIREGVLAMREEKGTLIMEGRVSYQCAGSFFHMPFVTQTQYEAVVHQAQALNPRLEEQARPWAWAQADGTYKLAPGFLLEYTRFQKGYVQGGVGISPRHTLSIINTGQGTAEEVATLAREMQQEVKNIFNVTLEREVEYVGEVEKE